MFKPIRIKINEIDRAATEALLQSNRRGVLAMNGDNEYPYAIPINYFYDCHKKLYIRRPWFRFINTLITIYGKTYLI